MFGFQEYDIRIQIVAIVGALGLMILVLELVRRQKLGEAYSIIWLILGTIILVFSLFRNLQVMLAHWVGVYYPPSLLLGIMTFLQLGVLLYLCVAISRLENRSRKLAQQLALLEYYLKRVSAPQVDSQDTEPPPS